MTLFDAESGKNYEITGLFVEEVLTRRLQALGLNDGTFIHIENRKRNGALIVKIRGTRLALGKKISQGIEIREA